MISHSKKIGVLGIFDDVPVGLLIALGVFRSLSGKNGSYLLSVLRKFSTASSLKCSKSANETRSTRPIVVGKPFTGLDLCHSFPIKADQCYGFIQGRCSGCSFISDVSNFVA